MQSLCRLPCTSEKAKFFFFFEKAKFGCIGAICKTEPFTLNDVNTDQSYTKEI